MACMPHMHLTTIVYMIRRRVTYREVEVSLLVGWRPAWWSAVPLNRWGSSPKIVSNNLHLVALAGLVNSTPCRRRQVAGVCAAVQWSGDVIKLTASSEGLGLDSACPPGFRTQLHVTTSLSTGGGPVSCVPLSEGGFQMVYPLGLWSRSSGVVKVRHGYGK